MSENEESGWCVQRGEFVQGEHPQPRGYLGMFAECHLCPGQSYLYEEQLRFPGQAGALIGRERSPERIDWIQAVVRMQQTRFAV